MKVWPRDYEEAEPNAGTADQLDYHTAFIDDDGDLCWVFGGEVYFITPDLVVGVGPKPENAIVTKVLGRIVGVQIEEVEP